MRKQLALLGLLMLAGAPAAAEVALSDLLGKQSSLSSEYRDLIRPPEPGALKGQPRPPRLPEGAVAEVPPFAGRQTAFEGLARAAARRNQVPEDLFLRLVVQESNFYPAAVSSKGAVGLAQLMPETARLLGVDPLDPGQNLDGGARYLRQQFLRFGDWRLALAAYNAGPAAVERYRGVPPYSETRNYVRAILGR